jgi:DNA-binding NarL/FixJ family response regulator
MIYTGMRALVIEDDFSWQEILTEILRDYGLAVDVVASLEAASVQMRAEAHSLAVVDLSLGNDPHNQDGLRALDGLRRFDPGCKSILLTGFATVELAVSSITEYGALTCLRKETFQRSEFQELVQRILASSPPGEKLEQPGSGLAQDSSSKRVITPEKKGTVGGDDIAKKSALVVEDDAGWRSILAELLVEAGYQVRMCTSFGEALGCLRRERYRLAVVDLSLEGPLNLISRSFDSSSAEHPLEGYRLLASTRAGEIPTIVVSGVASPEEIERAYTDQGIFAFIQKQAFRRSVFLQTVKDALIANHNNGELDILTDREREVLELLARGLTNKEIAESLTITTNTVKRHLKAIFEKLEVHTRSAAAAKAIR